MAYWRYREEETVTDTNDTPPGETFVILTVAAAPMSLPSTSNTEDTPMGETHDMLMGSALADRRSEKRRQSRTRTILRRARRSAY